MRTLLAALTLSTLAIGCDPASSQPRLCRYVCGECHYVERWGDESDPCILQPDGTCQYPPPWPDCERDGGV